MGADKLRRSVLAGMLAAAAIAAGSGALWAWAAGQVDTAIERWSDEQRVRGWNVTYAGPELGGYPLAVTAILDDPAVGSPHGWRWAGERLAGRAKVWAPLTLELDLPRRQTLHAEVRGETRRVALDSAAGDGKLVFRGDGAVEMAEVELRDLNASGDPDWQMTAARLHAGVGIGNGANAPDWLLNAESSDIVLPEAARSPFGDSVRRLAVQAAVFGQVPPGDPAEGLAAWRDAGGRIEVEAFELRHGPLDLLAQGTVVLDALLRPQGELKARIGGLSEALDTLTSAGLIDKNAALALKLSALALARREDGTGRPVVELPLFLQEGWAYLGPLPLFRLRPVI